MEGECPHEPLSAVRKDGFGFHCGATGGTSVCSSAGKQTLAPPGGGHAATPKTSASLRLCVKKTFNSQRSTLNFLRARTPALPTAHTQNTLSTCMPLVTNDYERSASDRHNTPQHV